MDKRVDVLVIGSGAAGGALTWRLASVGAKVVCLEQGDWVNAAEYPSARPLWEIQVRRGAFNLNPNIRRRPEDYPVFETGGNPPFTLMFNAVGGSTIHWAAYFPRFHPSDFRTQTLDGVGDDWPIRFEDLAPYYDLNDKMMGVAGLAGDPANPPRAPRPTPPLPIGKLGGTLARAFTKLGWHWWVTDNAIISQAYDGRPACDLHGKCLFGCPIGSKASTDVTYWPKALQLGAVLKTRSRVREITVDNAGRAHGALYYDRDGQLREQLARVLVVCCNGIGTPRLLLHSRSRLFPQGLANANGVVGRSFMIHCVRHLEGVFEEEMDGHLGPRGSAIYSQEFYETDTRRGFARGYTLWVGRTFGPLDHALGGWSHKTVPWGTSHHHTMRRRFPHIVPVWVLGEDLAVETNRVELDPGATDSSGIPAARVAYTHGENSLRMLEHGAAMGRQALEAAGALEVLDSGPIQPGYHLMGTARMGNDPRRSVVNAWHQVHGVKNLFIVDGSSFVTSAGVNPTATIGALALRCADGIWDRRREWA